MQYSRKQVRLLQFSSVWHNQENINKLQRVQNSLARVVSGTPYHAHIQPVLKDLHWLPVSARIDYKIALISHKVLLTQQPQYLTEIVMEYKPARVLRSGLLHMLTSNKPKSSIARQSFNYASEQVWNSLPLELRASQDTTTFKKKLKTELFRRSF